MRHVAPLRDGGALHPYLHLSVDDVIDDLTPLFGRAALEDPWRQPTFALLRTLHERYGVVFSLYLFRTNGVWNLDGVDGRHRDAFASASSWLRFGFHGEDAHTSYGRGSPPERAGDQYAAVARAIVAMAGEEALDRLPRIHRYTGHRDVLRAWRRAHHGITGLLTAEDDRSDTYHLDRRQRARLLALGEIVDEREGLTLVRTHLRLEASSDPVGDLRRLEPRSGVRVFTHAPLLTRPDVREALAGVAAWAAAEGLVGAFPADRIDGRR